MYQHATSESTSFTPPELFAGEAPIITNAFPVSAGVSLEQYRVVALDSAGDLVVWDPAGAAPLNQAVGIMPYAVDNTAGQNPTADIYVGGFFNTDALVWNAGATPLQIQNAFIGTKIEHRSLA